MNKVSKLYTTLLLFLLTGLHSHAQFDQENLSFGGGIGSIGYTYHIGTQLGFNIRSNYALDENVSLSLGYNYALPFYADINGQVAAQNSSIQPSTLPINIQQRIVYHNIVFDFQSYLFNDQDEPWGIYGIAGLGFTFANLSYDISDYDASRYTLTGANAYQDASYKALVMDLGLGAHVKINDELSLFSEFKIGMPLLNNYQDHAEGLVGNPIPFNYSLFIGARYSPFLFQ